MLVDEATIFVRSGFGGVGIVSLLREKDRPYAGPDGGDGGRGGDVILVGDPHLDTLIEFAFKPHHFAENGEKGGGKCCHGKDAPDLRVRVPLGSVIVDATTGEFVADITEPNQEVVVAPGGKGGFGNAHFKTSTNQTPNESHPPGEAIERTLHIELKLIADIGLVGLPNAGKSTMLKAVSRANPKVAAYPFTTLKPQLGLAELPGDRRLIIADIPGLIEGASSGHGLGHDFLRHIERTKAIVHLVELEPLDGSDPAANYRTIRAELHAFSTELAEKQEIVAFSKADLMDDDDRVALVRRLSGEIGIAKDEPYFVVSGATGLGMRELLEACWTLVKPEADTWRRT